MPALGAGSFEGYENSIETTKNGCDGSASSRQFDLPIDVLHVGHSRISVPRVWEDCMRHDDEVNHHPVILLGRLDAIGASLAHRDHALALIGLGSGGTALARLDLYSDLDFFAIVERGHQSTFIQNLDWLKDVAPIAFSFKNTDAGCKVLFEDDIYAEFAVFDREELASIALDGGRVIWQRQGIKLSLGDSQQERPPQPDSTERLLGESLTNLYVGLTRLHRGERLSAQRLIQGHAVDRILQLNTLIESPGPTSEDPFDSSRRFEQRCPHTAQQLHHFVQGYNRSTESALAILGYLEQHFPVNEAIARRIRELASTVVVDP